MGPRSGPSGFTTGRPHRLAMCRHVRLQTLAGRSRWKPGCLLAK